MNKTVISFAKKYNLKYTEIQYMYGLTGYVFDFEIGEHDLMYWCRSKLSRHKNLVVECNYYAMCIKVYDRKEKEAATAFGSLVHELHEIFYRSYHENKNGNLAYKKVVDFVTLHPEYKEAFNSIYN